MNVRAGKALVIVLALLPFALVVAGKLLLDDDDPSDLAARERAADARAAITRTCERRPGEAYIAFGKLLAEYGRNESAARPALKALVPVVPGDDACAAIGARARAALRR